MRFFDGPAIRGLIAFGLIGCAAHGATLVQRPYLQNERPDRGTIMWSTRENLLGSVQYSTDRSFAQSVPAVVREFQRSVTGLGYTFYQYRADLSGLAPGTEYSYQVTVGGQNLTPDD